MTPKPIAALALGVVVVLAVAAAAVAAADEKPATQPAGVRPWSQKDFVHPPLKCMEPYKRIDEYPVSAWCFHGIEAAKSPYGDDYVRNAKAVGFNVLIDDERILPYAQNVGGVKVQLAMLWLGPAKLEQRIFKNPEIGDHPLVQGIILGDNSRGFGQLAITTAAWMKQNYPHIMPILSQYPARLRGDTPLRILHMQNYPFMRGRSRNPPNHYLVQCNTDRLGCNANDMALWECYAGDASYSRVRFQMMAALAYGAQGLSNFCYSPHRMRDYKPDSPMIPLWKKLHKYVINVLGRHVWGTRCIDVIHAPHGGEHPGAPRPGKDKIIVGMSDFLMAGLLTPEAKFLSKDPADREIPEYFMVVDKRTGGATPKLRDVFVMLGTSIHAVEVLDAEATKDTKVRKIVPGWKIRTKMEGGDGLLLRVPPDLQTLLGGEDGRGLYDQINRTMAELQWKLTPPAEPASSAEEPVAEAEAPKVTAREVERAVAAAKVKLAELEKVLNAAAEAGSISQDQAADTIARLRAAIDATCKEARPPAD
ncbi:MAG: hypothetical protein ACYTF6_10885 [Planctomycetota bacterium]|jgi:hypothetical protein